MLAATLVHVDVAEQGLVGVFEAPQDGMRHPAVVVLGGSEGGIPAPLTHALAQAGFAVFGAAYFRGPGEPATLRDVPLERVTAAAAWLQQRAEADPRRLGLLGVSKGGELALVAAAQDPRYAAVAAVVPSAYVWFSLDFASGLPESSSWSLGGAPLAYLPSDAAADTDVARAFATGATFAYRNVYDASFAHATTQQRERAAIPVQRIAAPVLCVGAEYDQEWDSAAACTSIGASRTKAGLRTDTYVEPGAGHTLSLTGQPGIAKVRAGSAVIDFGGTPDANARGGKDAFERIVSFFTTALSRR